MSGWLHYLSICALLILPGCATIPNASTRYLGSHPSWEAGGPNPFKAEIEREIAMEPPGNYFVGRRYYKEQYKIWGYIRKPREPWRKAQLVMLNENRMLAPDRAANKLGDDDGVEYRMEGYFSGDIVYEPTSNGFFPEFVLTGIQVKNPQPLSIYRDGRPNDPTSNVIQRPQ